MTQNTLPEIHALWIGEQLNDIARCCLYSFIQRGHIVNLYTYDTVKNLPEDIIIKDGNSIIPKENIIKHKQTGSFALFSDIFRYELLRKVEGIYVDCDVYCLSPLTIPESSYLFGFEDDRVINGAILALPRDSKLLNHLIDCTYNPYFVPPWYSSSKQKRLYIKKKLGFGRSIADMPWGVIGPDAITYFAKETGADVYAMPIDVLYPIHYHRINMMLDKSLFLSDITTSRSKTIHLYNEFLRKIDIKTIDNECLLFQMLHNQI